ncbi:MAG: hypothetical protein WAU01_02305 [Saprospiraceae bacterium]
MNIPKIVSPKSFSTVTKNNPKEIASADVAIYSDQSYVRCIGNNKYRLSAVVHATPTGDDDATNVNLQVLLPVESNITILNAKIGSINILQSRLHVSCGYITFNIGNLTKSTPDSSLWCKEHFRLDMEFANVNNQPSTFGVGLFAYAERPADCCPENNYWFWNGSSLVAENCQDHTLIIAPNKLKGLKIMNNKIPIPEICKYVVQCPPGCGNQSLCAGSIIDLRELVQLKNAALIYQNEDCASKEVKMQNGKILVPMDYINAKGSYLIIDKK